MRIRLACVLAPVVLLLPLVTPAALAETLVSSLQKPPGKPLDLAEFLTSREIACEGVLTSWARETRIPMGHCRAPSPQRINGYAARISVTSVVSGVVDDSVLSAFVWTWPGPSPRLGTPVVFWGYHDCADDWRITGLVAYADSLGRLHSLLADDVMWLRGQGRHKRPTLAALRARIPKARSASGGRAVLRSNGLGLVRVTHITKTRDRCEVACEPLSRIVGTRAPPSAITFHPGDACEFDLAVGDSLVVPITSKADVSVCPDQFRVEHGFVPWFGTWV